MNSYVIIYIASLVAANLLVAWLGPWFSPVNAMLLIGLDLSLRDKLHDAWQGRHLLAKLACLIAAAGCISWALNPAAGQIALASVSAFAAAMAADSIAYEALRSKRWVVRANGSNLAGAVVDSVLFPTIAFGGLLPHIVLMQLAAKVCGGAVWAWLLRK